MSNPVHSNDCQRLKILALHGYRQNAETFRQKTGSFRKLVNKWAEFVFITAPHKVEIPNEVDDNINIEQSNEESQYGWFFNKEDKSFRGTRKGGPAIGFEESLTLVEESFNKLGPFDGIWGFSQGACFASLLCDLQRKGSLKFNFKFAVMIAGFKSGSLPHSQFFDEKITVPTLHVFGDGDQIIPVEMSEALSECCENPVVVRHTGGHYVPASSSVKKHYQDFFMRQFMLKNKMI